MGHRRTKTANPTIRTPVTTSSTQSDAEDCIFSLTRLLEKGKRTEAWWFLYWAAGGRIKSSRENEKRMRQTLLLRPLRPLDYRHLQQGSGCCPTEADTRGRLPGPADTGESPVNPERVRVSTRFPGSSGCQLRANIPHSSGLKPGDEFSSSLTENILKNANPIKAPRSAMA